LIRATVLVPTHEHGPLLRYAVESALRQTVREIEVVIVGDGADEATAREAEALADRDPRVRFLSFPKGPRLGEVHRTEALRSARGNVVCYLADDDLWLPGHIESVLGALEDADFVNGRAVVVFPDQSLAVLPGHFAIPGVRERLQTPWNFVSLSCGAHTRALYDRLPGGWETTPADVWTDLHMWRRLLSVPGCRPASAARVTVVHFPSPYRKDWSLARREDELREWAGRVAAPGFEAELTVRALDVAVRAMAGYDLALHATAKPE
jgi:glycosyltransferase involved in cell wall biosynthesis